VSGGRTRGDEVRERKAARDRRLGPGTSPAWGASHSPGRLARHAL